MRGNLIMRTWLVAMFFALFGVTATPLRAEVPLVYATLEPKKIALGDSAELRITSLANGAEPIKLPVVAGLQFEVLGRSHQFEITNGVTLSSTSLVVRVTPQIAGIFTIPPVTAKSQPLVLEVNADHGPVTANKPGNSNYMIRPPVLPTPPAINGIRLTADGAAFVKLNLPKRAVYVGESVPVDIQVGMRSGFVTSLNGLPTLTGGEFTLNNLSHQPERQETTIGGKPFTLMTWHSVLAAVKPGKFALALEAPLTVKISTRPKGEAAFDDLLGDPFLQNFFGPTVSKEITVASPAADLTVLALPTEGRPADFSGAVGSFKISSDLAPTAGAAGDPLTLRMHVSGAGNFDRVDSPMLGQVDQWKTYPPKSSFAPADPIGYRGEKTFEQPLIATKPGAQKLPGLAFSYFDPSTRHYEVARSAPMAVDISPSWADGGSHAPPVGVDATTGAAAGPAAAVAGLRPDHAARNDTTNSLIPMYLQPKFLVLPSLLALAFAGAWLGLRRRPVRELPKATGRVLAQLETAARSGDAVLFFDTARTAIQHALAEQWHIAPEQVTVADIDSRLGAAGDELRRLFILADESRYGGTARATEDFAQWIRVVRTQLVAEASA